MGGTIPDTLDFSVRRIGIMYLYLHSPISDRGLICSDSLHAG